IAVVDEGGMFRVGPRSAGAVPGPACYARGGTGPPVRGARLVGCAADSGLAAGGSGRAAGASGRAAGDCLPGAGASPRGG
ncbi:hydantoinase/oxoprolinase family protein, partial [Nocardia vermiculata]|uniref:hydantoinase/oxoprolinase family protein n=1 Tax=Nocardia vermiculata TaxID=257274 RepID=UPI0035E3E7E7